MHTAHFFSHLRTRLDEARRENRRTLGQFFGSLSPRLTTARRRERERDRREARRFNALDYLKTDELGLSRIVADLLDPHAAHDQNQFFLQKLLSALKKYAQFDPGVYLERSHVSVELEQTIAGGRRIDILVRLTDGRSRYALAFENKPFAEDQRHQVRDYLLFLRESYGKNFLLIYLSPAGEGPSDWSIPTTELHANWAGRFAILPYHQTDPAMESDKFEAFRLPYSLTRWLEACQTDCKVNRLQWFLGDTLQFCQRTFGGQTMTSESEFGEIQDYVFENPAHLETALAVFQSWPSIRDTVCKRFLDRVCSRIRAAEALEPYAEDLHIKSAYGGDTAKSNCIWFYRDRWMAYPRPDTSTPPQTQGRIAFLLRTDGRELRDWIFGVRRPTPKGDLADEEIKRRRRLNKQLLSALGPSRSRSDWWPWWVYADEGKRHWNPLVPALHRECQAEEDGDIIRYFVDTFVDFAVKAIPVIDEIEA